MSQRPTTVHILRTSGLDQGKINSAPEAGKGSTSEQDSSKPKNNKTKQNKTKTGIQLTKKSRRTGMAI